MSDDRARERERRVIGIVVRTTAWGGWGRASKKIFMILPCDVDSYTIDDDDDDDDDGGGGGSVKIAVDDDDDDSGDDDDDDDDEEVIF